jgi:predicted DNA-binding protein YlxM (UPF0122 family)
MQKTASFLDYPATIIENINPEDFIPSGAVQIRQETKRRPGGLDYDQVNQYARDMLAGARFPNIHSVRSQVDDGQFVIFDGFHRHAALKRACQLIHGSFTKEWNGVTQEPTLGATIVEGKFTPHQLRWFAFKANKVHGLPLTFKERSAAFEIFIDSGIWKRGQGQRMSLSEIGLEFGITKQAVADRLKRKHEKLYAAYFSREGEALPRWEGQNGKNQIGGLDDMNKNLATLHREHVEQVESRIQEMEALGLPKARAQALREQYRQANTRLSERIAAAGIKESDDFGF